MLCPSLLRCNFLTRLGREVHGVCKYSGIEINKIDLLVVLQLRVHVGWRFLLLLVPAEPGHDTSTSGWIYSSNLYMSLMCYSLYDAVIVRARSSRMEGSRWLVVVLLIVFSFSLC